MMENKKQKKDNKILIQIIDVSDKMLYNHIKVEQNFLELINAAVSHELRNPLSSLIG
jgi:signal transduction histidine kinase